MNGRQMTVRGRKRVSKRANERTGEKEREGECDECVSKREREN
jgi:hypothetical protein